MSPVDKEVLDGLSLGIQAELASYVFYKKSMELTKDAKLRDILAELAGEEKHHYLVLEGQYDNLVRSEMWNTITDVIRQEGLPDINERMDEVEEELLEEVTESTTPTRILEIALILEERAYNLYSELAKQVDDPKGKDTYNYLAKFEIGHVNKIKKMMKNYQ
jgi:rubrerythrin